METLNSSKNGLFANARRFAFDDVEVDPLNRTCTRAGEALPITGKVYDILLAFLENPGRLLSKDELIDRVWPGEFVEEGNLARNVSTLRKVLGDTERRHRYILTVPGHGYRFVAEVRTSENEKPSEIGAGRWTQEINFTPVERIEPTRLRSRKLIWILAGLILLFTAAWFGKDRLFTASPTVKSLAMLPLRGIDPNDNYLGVGIADAVIRRISSSGQVAVRPTSAVLHYLNQDTDTLAAARELNTDAILEGNVQRSGDRLRVSVNLLRTSNGLSIWNDSFDLQEADIFRIQDEVAEQLADKLKIRLGTGTSDSNSKYPVNPAAYELYVKGVFSLDQRGYEDEGLPQMMETIDYFKKAIDIDPTYALAHGKLAFAYAWTALFIKPGEPQWAELARNEIASAQELDPNIADPHVASGLLLWSNYGGFQTEAALREFQLARQLDPNYSGADLAAMYGHIGLEPEAEKELQRILAIDPTSASLKDLVTILAFLRGDPDAWLASRESKPRTYVLYEPWYYLRKGDLNTAKKAIDERTPKGLEYPDFLMIRALYLALNGDLKDATSEVPGIMNKVDEYGESRHHITYHAACVYAVAGDSANAVKWLRETANTGFPDYPLFARDPFLDRIRQSPEFVQFLAEQKAQYERFKQEFGDQ